MKRAALALVLLLVSVQAAVTSSSSISDPTPYEGDQVTLTWSKSIDGATDGIQQGSVTPIITGPTGATLATKPYNFASLTPETETLTWTWTPTGPGLYDIHFDDTVTDGLERDEEILDVAVYEAPLPPVSFDPDYRTFDINGDPLDTNWGGWIPQPDGGPCECTNYLKLTNPGSEPRTYLVQFRDTVFQTQWGHVVEIPENIRFRYGTGATPAAGITDTLVIMDGRATFEVDPQQVLWLGYVVESFPSSISTSQYTAPFTVTVLE